MKGYFFDMYIHDLTNPNVMASTPPLCCCSCYLDGLGWYGKKEKKRGSGAGGGVQRWEREREGGEGQVRSEILFLFWAQLFLEHAVAPYQTHMAVLRNDYITACTMPRNTSSKACNYYESLTKCVCMLFPSSLHVLFLLFLFFCLLFVVCCLLFVFLLIDKQGLWANLTANF